MGELMYLYNDSYLSCVSVSLHFLNESGILPFSPTRQIQFVVVRKKVTNKCQNRQTVGCSKKKCKLNELNKICCQFPFCHLKGPFPFFGVLQALQKTSYTSLPSAE